VFRNPRARNSSVLCKNICSNCNILSVRYEYDPEQFADNQIPLMVIGTKADLAQSLRENVKIHTSSVAEECGAEELNLVCLLL